MAKRIKIAIDPQLKEKFGPEICWTWRLILSGIGLSWEEVSVDSSEYEIAYLTKDASIGNCRLCIRADIRYWDHRSDYKLTGIGEEEGWQYPIFEGEDCPTKLFHVNGGPLIIEEDIIFYVFWMATGQGEVHQAKNKHGQINLERSNVYQKEILSTALASGISFKLGEELTKRGFVSAVERWPEGKNAAACVSHDVDYPEIIRWLEPLRIIQRQGVAGLKAALSVFCGKRTHWNFASWVALEKTLNIKSVFNFTAREGSLYQYATGTPDPFYDVKSSRFREVLRYLTGEGFEIGLHASYRAFESKDNFAHEKQTLEEASAQKIYGNRHHYLHLNPKDPESTLLLHEELNFKYDTSLMHERYVGWRRGLCWPFFPFHQRKRRQIKVLQIPTVWEDNHFFGYRDSNPGNRHEILRKLSAKTAEQGGCLLIDVHDYVFDDLLFPGWVDTYRKLFEYILARSDFWVKTPRQIADYWIERYNSIQEASKGLAEGY